AFMVNPKEAPYDYFLRAAQTAASSLAVELVPAPVENATVDGGLMSYGIDRVDLNRSKLALKYYGPAHTDSDISITFPEADILHCGDTYWNGIYPFIDYSTGGNIDGMIKAAEANVAAVTDKTIVIPGHGQPVSNKAKLTEYRDMLLAIR